MAEAHEAMAPRGGERILDEQVDAVLACARRRGRRHAGVERREPACVALPCVWLDGGMARPLDRLDGCPQPKCRPALALAGRDRGQAGEAVEQAVQHAILLARREALEIAP